MPVRPEHPLPIRPQQQTQTGPTPILIVVALFAGRNGDGQPVLRWWQWAGCVRRKCAGRIYKFVEIEPQFSRLRYVMIGQVGIEKTSGAVGGYFAGLITKNEEEFPGGGILEHRLQAKHLSLQSKLGRARRGQLFDGAEDRRNVERPGRIVGNPFRPDSVLGIWRVLVQAMKSGARRRVEVLDAKGDTLIAMDEDDREGANFQF